MGAIEILRIFLKKKFFINNERVEFVLGVGGCNKRNSSSNILNKWNS